MRSRRFSDISSVTDVKLDPLGSDTGPVRVISAGEGFVVHVSNGVYGASDR
jgi:hypothetical protein